MPNPVQLQEVVEFIADCEHRTAPAVPRDAAYAFSIGTPSIRGGRILLDSARPVDQSTYESWTQRGRPQAEDLILAREAPVGDVGRVDGNQRLCLGQRTVLLRPDQRKVNPRFLHYLLLSPPIQRWMQDRAAGSTVSHLNVEDVYKIVLGELPSLAKQRAIAEVLGALDDKIEANDRTGSFCDLMIEVAFRVIEDVEGVAAIPLFDLVDFTFGEPFSSEQFNDTGEGRPLVRIRDLKTFRPQVWTTESRPNETVIDPGDVVIGMDAEFRATFWLGLRGLLNQRVCLARTGIGSPALVREILRAPLALVEGYKTGTTVSHLNKSDLAAIRVARPSASAVEAFSAMAEPLRQAIVGLAAESRTLVSLRDALLPKLLSGELRVRDAETLVEEAV